MIIAHEPTFAVADSKEYADEIELKKWKLLEDSNIVLYRYHDHAHIDEYVRDACFFNENKSVLILGHYGSEYYEIIS